MAQASNSPQDEQSGTEPNKNPQTPLYAADSAATSVTDASEPQTSDEDQRKPSVCSENLSKESPSKDEHDGSCYKSVHPELHQKAEFWNRLGSNLKNHLRKKSDDVHQGYEDNFVACQDLTSRSSHRLQHLEQTLLSLSSQCHVLRGTGGCLQGHIKSMSASEEAEFYHHAQAAAFSQHYAQLQHLQEQRAQLLFLHEYGRRCRAAKCFLLRLDDILERARLLRSRKDQSLEEHCWNLGLGSMSEELQVHLSHWDLLYTRARSDLNLRRVLVGRTEMLESIRRTLWLLGLQTLLLMEKCIHTQLLALAAAQMACVSSDVIEDLMHAAKMYNHALAYQRTQQRAAAFSLQILLSTDCPRIRSGLSGINVRPAPFSVMEIMRIVAQRRAQIAAEKFYSWACDQADFLLVVAKTDLHWRDLENPNPRLQPTSAPTTPKNPSHSISNLPLKSFFKCDREEILETFLPALASSTGLLISRISKRPPSDKTGDTRSAKQRTHKATELQQGLSNKLTEHKPVQEIDSCTLTVCMQLFSQYSDILWKEFSNAAIKQFYHQPHNSTLGCINQWNFQMVFLLVKWLKHDCKEDFVPTECTEALHQFCLHIVSTAAFMHWDEMMCRSLGLGLKDKCLPRQVQEQATVRTSTMDLTLQLFPPLLSVLHLLQTSQPNSGPTETRSLSVYHLGLLHRAQATVQSSIFWVMSKAFQFLASWSLSKFLLVTQGDLKVLSKAVETLCQQMKDVDRGAEHIIMQYEMRLTGAVSQLQAFSELVLRIFSTYCKKMAGEIFAQTMPSAKHWRSNHKTETPSAPSDYASYAAQSVIGQVLEGVQTLPDEARMPALAEAMTAFMEAWMEHILKQKVKFSVVGALQLKQDFDLIRDLIRSEKYSLSDELHHQLLSLRVFHQVDCAIACLLQQPATKPYMSFRRWEPFRHCCPNRAQVVDQGLGSLNNLETMENQAVCHQALTSAEGSITPELVSSAPPESYLAVAQQEWLDLRVHTGSRWRIPGLHCFTKSEP